LVGRKRSTEDRPERYGVLEANTTCVVLTFLQRGSVCHSKTSTATCAQRIDLQTDTNIDRTKRIKEARDEAKKEISAYRASKEAEFKKFEAEVCLTNPNHL
jgi:hypothetical protein